MPGIVMPALSEDEMDRILEWGRWYPMDTDDPNHEVDVALYGRLLEMRGEVACRVDA